MDIKKTLFPLTIETDGDVVRLEQEDDCIVLTLDQVPLLISWLKKSIAGTEAVE